ncbi:hypothetical protein HFP51_12895 [Parasphingopyxis sp. CP4]|uniref:hypothetical protein n=1 Tax=Parasphingopyxis sp. CP4 TaxID=2724527 RepID=UPI0015A42CEA|nr:hypothetical protein [Parasphingopyxis sp. CP4]QLC23004.1 hypothetical protein HFP51_12895 [Parasphingopyxis sp. CP4]
MTSTDHVSVDHLPLPQKVRVTFSKYDMLTWDLKICDVDLDGPAVCFTEEVEHWEELIAHLSQLPDFDVTWHEKLALPPFAANPVVAFLRADQPDRKSYPMMELPPIGDRQKISTLLRASTGMNIAFLFKLVLRRLQRKRGTAFDRNQGN